MTDRQPTPEYMERAAVVLADVFGIADYRPGLTRRVALALEDAATEAVEVWRSALATQCGKTLAAQRPSPAIEELVRAAERRFEEKVSEAVIAFGNLSKGQLSYEAAGIVVDLAAALSAFRQSSQARGEGK